MSKKKTNDLLKLVSRSFALCIPVLPNKIQKNVGNFYLLCRYADSIEDSNMSTNEKKHALKEFFLSIKNEDFEKLEKTSTKIYPLIISNDDKIMIYEFKHVLEEYKNFDKKTKKISLKWLKSMIFGMEKYSRKEIDNFKDLNNYCYFVAGTVGMYLTEMFENKFEIVQKNELTKRAKDFGLLLQKVNIIRDFSKDYSQGRVFWPKSLFRKHNVSIENVFDDKNSFVRKKILKEMINNTQKNIKNAIEYIDLLPSKEIKLKMFCAIPFCMALPTLMKCDNNDNIFKIGEKVKIERRETIKILSNIKQNINDGNFVKVYYEEIISK